MARDLTHFDANGNAVMVDVSDKGETERTATACGLIRMAPETLATIREGRVKKGDPLSVAQLAGIMGAKRTPDLIPLCHPLPITQARVLISASNDFAGFNIRAEVSTRGRTGVEMEALTAVTVAALTVYDMCKALDKGITRQELAQYVLRFSVVVIMLACIVFSGWVITSPADQRTPEQTSTLIMAGIVPLGQYIASLQMRRTVDRQMPVSESDLNGIN